jgi:hypothetical protein
MSANGAVPEEKRSMSLKILLRKYIDLSPHHLPEEAFCCGNIALNYSRMNSIVLPSLSRAR